MSNFIPFTKMHGAGNDYVFLDGFQDALPANPTALAPRVADRHFGIGSDGLVLIERSDIADARMRMFNADGSESEMCGNAIRCVAKLLADRRHVTKNPMQIETGAGIRTLHTMRDEASDFVTRVRVDMGEPILTHEIETMLSVDSESAFPVTCVSMGNPHAVVFVESLSDAWVHHIGPKVEVLPCFPRRTNVEFVECISPQSLKMRVWERGTGETLACGTGACAALVAAVLTGRAERRAVIHLRGGDLEIEWLPSDNHVWMTGDAIEVFSGNLLTNSAACVL